MADDPTEPSETAEPLETTEPSETAEPEDPTAEGAAGADEGSVEKATKPTKTTKPARATRATRATKRADAAQETEGEGAVVRKRVTSKRVTPKGSAQGVKATSSSPSSSKGSTPGDDDFSYSKRYTPPKATYAPGPSPWWVPALMFGLLVVGALIIMANYMGAFGEAENLRLVIGLAFILGGIITATQYR